MVAELGRVQFGDATIEYDVQRSERRKKTVQITMDGGRVLVAAPSDTPDSKLEPLCARELPGSSGRHRTQSFKHHGNASSAEKRCPTWAATSV